MFLYNNLATTQVFNDVGLEIPSHEYFEIAKQDDLENIYYTGSEVQIAVSLGYLSFTSADTNYPPSTGDIISSPPPDGSGGSATQVGEIDGGIPSTIYTIEQNVDCGGVV